LTVVKKIISVQDSALRYFRQPNKNADEEPRTNLPEIANKSILPIPKAIFWDGTTR
jgi:hypothetical protein